MFFFVRLVRKRLFFSKRKRSSQIETKNFEMKKDLFQRFFVPAYSKFDDLERVKFVSFVVVVDDVVVARHDVVRGAVTVVVILRKDIADH